MFCCTFCSSYVLNMYIVCCFVTGNTSWLCNKAHFQSTPFYSLFALFVLHLKKLACLFSTYKTSCRLLGMTLSIINIYLYHKVYTLKTSTILYLDLMYIK